MTAKPPSSKHGFRAIPLEDFDWEAARHFARTNGTSVEEALFEYTREQYVNQLLTEWQSASQIFCRFIERMAPHASPVEIVLALRETAKTYDDLVTAGLLMRDGVKLLFLVNELASRILSRQELREEEEKAARTKNEAALRFALFEKLLPKPLYGLIVRNAHCATDWHKLYRVSDLRAPAFNARHLPRHPTRQSLGRRIADARALSFRKDRPPLS